MLIQWIGKGRSSNKFTLHPDKPCDLFNQLAKKLVTRAAALLARTPGIRRLQQNRLPLRSTCGQSGIPKVAFSSLSDRHQQVHLSISILSRTFLERTIQSKASAVAGRVSEPPVAAPICRETKLFAPGSIDFRWTPASTHEHTDNCNFSIMIWYDRHPRHCSYAIHCMHSRIFCAIQTAWDKVCVLHSASTHAVVQAMRWILTVSVTAVH